MVVQVHNRNYVIVPAGTYILGDPCYATPNECWDEAIETSDIFNDPVGYITVEGNRYPILGFGTAYGDGTYLGSDGFEYSVDAGLIGLVPYDVGRHMFDPVLHRVIVFDEDTLCTNDNGNMMFGDIRIDTSGADMEDNEYY